MGSCIGIPDCMTAEEIREVTLEDEHVSAFAELILHGWLSTNLRYKRKCNPIGHAMIR